jgi:hypothetical protein
VGCELLTRAAKVPRKKEAFSWPLLQPTTDSSFCVKNDVALKDATNDLETVGHSHGIRGIERVSAAANTGGAARRSAFLIDCPFAQKKMSDF